MAARLMRTVIPLAVLLGGIPSVSAAQPEPSNTALQAAIDQYVAGDFEGAVVTLGELVRNFSPEAPRARRRAVIHMWLGASYAMLDQEKAARANFREALTADSTLVLPESRFSPRVQRLFSEARAKIEAMAPAPTPAPTPILPAAALEPSIPPPVPTPMPPAAALELSTPPAAPTTLPVIPTLPAVRFYVVHRHGIGLGTTSRNQIGLVRGACEGDLEITGEELSFTTQKTYDTRRDALRVGLGEIIDYKVERDGRLQVKSPKGTWGFYAKSGRIDEAWRALVERLDNWTKRQKMAAAQRSQAGARGADAPVTTMPVAGGGPIPHGAKITVLLDTVLSTRRNRVGDRFWGRLLEPVNASGQVVARAGSQVTGEIRDIKENVRGGDERSSMTLQINKIETTAGEQTVFAETMLRNSFPQFDVPTYMKINFTVLTRPGERAR